MRYYFFRAEMALLSETTEFIMSKSNLKTVLLVAAGALAATMIRNKVTAVRRITG